MPFPRDPVAAKEIETRDDAALLLGSLCAFNTDAADTYREVARKVDDENLAKFFATLFVERDGHAQQLMEFLNTFAASTDEPSTSADDACHIAWTRVRGASEGDPASALNASHEAEQYLLAEYEAALETDALPDDIHQALKAHARNVRASRDRIEDWQTRA